MRNRLSAAALGLAVLSSVPGSVAAEPIPECSGPISRGNLVACALATSPALREELASQRAAQGRREAARPVLPANPVLSGALASRTGPTDQQLNWSLGLAQEVELAGQRGLRLDVAEGELRAQAARLAATQARIAADAWLAWFSAIAERERSRLALKLEAAASAVAATIRGMAANGLASEVDAEVAESAALRAAQDRLATEQQVAVSRARLRFLAGRAADPAPGDELVPLPIGAASLTASDRPELRAAREAQGALDRGVALLRRARVPNPTLSFFAQGDGFDERVFGGGLSIPIPLPQPIGRTLAGEIAERAALSDLAQAATERVQRELQAELEVAEAGYDASRKTRDLYPADRVQRAAARLEAIAVEVRAARLPVRDALVAQQALVEQLKAELDARERLCVASVRLRHAAGLSLQGDAR